MSDESLIRELEAHRYLAMQCADFGAFERLCHSTLVYVHSNGVQDTLEQYLHKCREGLYVYHQIDHGVSDVKLYGNLALAFGEMRAAITSHGVNKSIHNRTLSVWQRTDGRWQLIAYQPTPVIPQPAPAIATGE